MIQIACPWCGPRNSADLRYVGEARPHPGSDPNRAVEASEDQASEDQGSVEQWRAYLYTRANPAGWTTENWYCRAGCRRYFVVERHTVTHEVRSSRPPAAQLRIGRAGKA